MFQVIEGDCLEVLKTMPDCSVDAVVTDPPYGLSQHTPEQVKDCLLAWCKGEVYQPKGKGFMGKTWDAWVPGPEVWKEVLRVLKPGGHALVFAGTRSMDLMSMSLRLAGFELRDSIGHAYDDSDSDAAPLLAWVHGQGFPKNLDISKQIDKLHGAKREVVEVVYNCPGEKRNCMAGDFSGDRKITAPATPDAEKWDGFGTAIKPSWEPILLCRKPLEGTVAGNVLKHGTGGLNIGACRIGTDDNSARTPSNSATWGTYGNGKNNAAIHGTTGRWPANVVLTCSCDGADHSESCPVSQFPETKSGGSGADGEKRNGVVYGDWNLRKGGQVAPSTGSSARFFYTAKASKRDRDEGLENLPKTVTDDGRNKSIDNPYQRGETLRHNPHPTVKATPLMRWLCRLICPPGGVILDPFCGSGSTGKGAIPEGFKFIGIEQDPESVMVARARIAWAAGEPAPTLPPSAENEEQETAVTAPEKPKQLSLFGV